MTPAVNGGAAPEHARCRISRYPLVWPQINSLLVQYYATMRLEPYSPKIRTSQLRIFSEIRQALQQNYGLNSQRTGCFNDNVDYSAMCQRLLQVKHETGRTVSVWGSGVELMRLVLDDPCRVNGSVNPLCEDVRKRYLHTSAA